MPSKPSTVLIQVSKGPWFNNARQAIMARQQRERAMYSRPDQERTGSKRKATEDEPSDAKRQRTSHGSSEANKEAPKRVIVPLRSQKPPPERVMEHPTALKGSKEPKKLSPSPPLMTNTVASRTPKTAAGRRILEERQEAIKELQKRRGRRAYLAEVQELAKKRHAHAMASLRRERLRGMKRDEGFANGNT